MKINTELVTEKESKLFLRYLFPSVVATLLIAVNYLIDTICVGQRIGETGLAALNVVVPMTGLMYAMGFMMAYGSSNLFSNCMGAGQREKAKTYYGTSVAALALFSGVVMAVGLLFNEQISWLLCGGADFYGQTAEYLWYVFVFTPFYCFETFYNVYVRNDGAPVFSMLGTLTTCGSNMILDIVMIWVLDMGMRGASLATGLALVLGFCVTFFATCRRRSELKVWQCRVDFSRLGRILRNGMPDFLREFSGSAVVLIVNLLLLRLSGTVAVAAYGVIANLGNVVQCGLAGVSNATQPLISFNHGANRPDRIRKFLRMGLLASAALSAAYVVFAELRPDLLVAIFLDDPTPELTAYSIPGIRLISPGYLLGGLAVVLNVYLEARHRPAWAFWIALLRGFIAPIAFLLPLVMLFDVTGVWLSFLAAELAALMAAAAAVRYSDRREDPERL